MILLMNVINFILSKISKNAPAFLGFITVLLSLQPFRIWEKFLFPNQIETIVSVVLMAVFITTDLLIRFFKKISGIGIAFSNIDIVFLAYVSYSYCFLLFQHQNYSYEPIFEGFSLVVLYVLFRNFDHKTFACFLWVFPVVGIVQMAYGIKNQTGSFAPGYGLSDVTGIFNNTGIWGGFIAVVIVATLGWVFSSFKSGVFHLEKRLATFLKRVTLVLLCVFALQLFSSGSRAAWLGCIAGTFYIVGVKLSWRQKFETLSNLKKWVIAGTFICLITLMLYGLYQYKKNSADGRRLIWQVSGDMIFDKPLFGHGAGGFQAKYMEYQAAYFQRYPDSAFGNLADDNLYAFNEFIRIWVEKGVVGLLLIVLLLYFLFLSNKRLSKHITQDRTIVTAKASLLALVVFGLFSYPMEVFQFNLMAVFFIAMLSKHSPEIKYMKVQLAPDNQKSLKVALKIGIVGLWLAVALVITTLSYDYATTCKKWNSALKGFSETNPTNSIVMLETVYPRLKNNGIFLTTYGKVLTSSRQYKKAIEVLQSANCHNPSAANYINLGKCFRATGNYEHAKTAWAKASYMMPSQFTPKYLTAKMLFENGQISEAKKIAIELLRKEIKIGSPEVELMLDEMRELLKTTVKTKIMDIIYPK